MLSPFNSSLLSCPFITSLDLEIPLRGVWLLILLSLSFNQILASTSYQIHDHVTGSHATSVEKLGNPPLLGTGVHTWAPVMDTAVVCYLEWGPPFSSGCFPALGLPRATSAGQLQATSEHKEEQTQSHT